MDAYNTLMNNPQYLATFLVRVMLGMLFAIQGFDKIFRQGVTPYYNAVSKPYLRMGMPKFMVMAGIYFTSYMEFAGGLLLIGGFMKNITCYLLGLDLLVATFGIAMLEPMWDMKHVFPRFAMLIFLLSTPADWDPFNFISFFEFVFGSK